MSGASIKSLSISLTATAVAVFTTSATTAGACLALCLVAIGAAWRAVAVRVGGWHPVALFLIVSSLYALAALVEVTLLGNNLNLDEGLMVRLTAISTLFLVLTASAFLLVHRGQHAPRATDSRHSHAAAAVVLYCAMLLCVVVGITVYSYGLGVGSYSRADLYANENVALSVLRGALAVSFGVAASYLTDAPNSAEDRSRYLRPLYALLALYFVNDLLILGDRRLPMAALLSLAAVSRPRITWRRGAAAMLFLSLLILFGFVRNTPITGWLATLRSVDYARTLSPAAHEFSGIALIGSTIGDFTTLPSSFPSYADAFLQILPRAISPHRPDSAGEWFVWTYYPEVARTGAAFAFNAVLEALANGGWLAVILVSLTWGSIIALLSRVRSQGIAWGIPFCTYVFVFSMRMDLASLLRTALMAFGSVLMMYGGVTMLNAISRQRTSEISETHA